MSFCPRSSLKKVRSAVNSALKTACQTTVYYRRDRGKGPSAEPCAPDPSDLLESTRSDPSKSTKRGHMDLSG